MNGALISIKGRYPATGYAMNEICKELAFVVSGKGKICTTHETIEFAEHDTIFVDAGEKFYWEGPVAWGCFLDPGQTAKLVVRDGNELASCGNMHYLKWPQIPNDKYVWVPNIGRPTASTIALR